MARLDRLARRQGGGPGRRLHRSGVRLRAARGGLAGPEPELRAALDRLVGAELVFARGVPPEASYLFKHALVRDAAYGTLLRDRRRQLHGGSRTPWRSGSRRRRTAPELLARHLTEAGVAERAIPLLAPGGELAIGRSANMEAIAHCDEVEAEPDPAASPEGAEDGAGPSLRASAVRVGQGLFGLGGRTDLPPGLGALRRAGPIGPTVPRAAGPVALPPSTGRAPAGPGRAPGSPSRRRGEPTSLPRRRRHGAPLGTSLFPPVVAPFAAQRR